MNRANKIIELLKHLDAALEQDEMLVVCGGMAFKLLLEEWGFVR